MSVVTQGSQDMPTHSGIESGPIRVVVFGGGPVLERGIKQFICRLSEHPDIQFLGAFCQSATQSFPAVIFDLWRRRRFLALPVLVIQVASALSRFLMQPRAEMELKRKLARLSDRVHFVADIHAEMVLELIRSLEPDLGLIYGSPILKPKIFEIPRLGTLGIHHGKVPEYRGKKTTFWAILNKEKTVGVTIQKVNAGLDTGSIVKEGEVIVGNHSHRIVWNELEKLGLNLYIQAIIEVKEGGAIYRSQVGKKGKLYKDPKLRDILAFSRMRLKRFLTSSVRSVF
jgi:folate-dependent phosphoribosylglycinamide formyltransferase PurN